MLRNVSIISTVMMSILLIGPAPSGAAEPWPETWHRVMTNDPDTNYILNKYKEKSADVAVEYYKDMVLYAILSSSCRSAKSDHSVWLQYEKTVGYSKFSPDQKDNARFQAGMLFQGLDIKEAAQLCAGSMYLFGPKGVLISGLFSPGGKAPDETYDPRNPYLRIDVKQIEDMGHRSR